jgi:tetratricopeptide (TPR) repeat protein
MNTEKRDAAATRAEKRETAAERTVGANGHAIEREVSVHTLSDRINDAFEREDWSGARQLIAAKLKRRPDDHWLLARLSAACFEQKDYRAALRHIKKAIRIAPGCPLVWWDYAGTLLALGKIQDALALYKRIIAQGKGLADGPHGEGWKWAVALVIDCLFMIGVCHQHLKQRQKAADAFQLFIGYRARWRHHCLHSIDEALDRLKRLGQISSAAMAQEVEELQYNELLGAGV